MGKIYLSGGKWEIFSKCGARWGKFISVEPSGGIFQNVKLGGENLYQWSQVGRFFKIWDSVERNYTIGDH